MPYLRCPRCALLIHVQMVDSPGIQCSRCRAGLERRVRLVPLEESLSYVDVLAGRGGRDA